MKIALATRTDISIVEMSKAFVDQAQSFNDNGYLGGGGNERY